VDVLDVRELIRRLRLGETDRRIARDLGMSRKTVGKYRQWAAGQDLLGEGPLIEPAELVRRLGRRPPSDPQRQPSKVEPHRERVEQLRRQGVECRAILERLREEQEFTGSYSSVWRFVRRLEPRTPEAMVRVEVAAGAEAQVDFGYAGKQRDPKDGELKKAWAFVMLLSHSRHQYVELVFHQDVATWLACHQRAFEWFGGVPRRVVIDNLKAAIHRAVTHDPVVQRAYREFAEHYGFLISPCRPRTPRHKGKVEQGGVHYVKRNFLAGRSFLDLTEANEKALVWCTETAGMRIHGTTKRRPLEQFESVERKALLGLPPAPYEISEWKKVKLHPDCHVVFNGSYYSAPHRLIGKQLWLRATSNGVLLFWEHERVASHPRARRPGQRMTIQDHLPPAKLAGLMATPAHCLRRARTIGPHAAELIGRLLGDRPLDRLRTALGILRLADKYTPRRLEAACRRALCFDEVRYGAVKRILDRELDLEPLPTIPTAIPEPSQPMLFARPWTDFFPTA
jgi:transposase